MSLPSEGSAYDPMFEPSAQATASIPADDSERAKKDVHQVVSPRVGDALWDDETIASVRIPRDSLDVSRMIGSGAYTEVFSALYCGSLVTIKMLPPDMRRSNFHINALLAGAKLMARIEHPHIVRLVGVAWDSPTDLCLVVEYMEGGNLRALLDTYAAQGHPVGFNRMKMKIALHVANALTYLHSLDPPVLHRDVRSKKILLSAELEAKLTDFGVSRERAGRTMTAGVGTYLWMAPEVMLGEKYDDKADVFSFGVVLSELDTHVLPYSNAKENSDTGRKLPDAAILQMVALGKLRAEFSTAGPKAVMALGEACMAMDPKERPTAAEAMLELERILTDELQLVDDEESKTS
ncbi:hypothetical protein BBJ28_00003319 [Nothophytophthora sp. Chile5]|nr:hypothetical protein BBJ28_00003319 [Nothophytophthora sp. Chile5]